VIDVLDCRTPSGAYDPVGLHQGYFTENPYTGTSQCLNCHGKIGDDVMRTAHWKWRARSRESRDSKARSTQEGPAEQLLSRVPTNEGRCAQCHIGYGWATRTSTSAIRRTSTALRATTRPALTRRSRPRTSPVRLSSAPRADRRPAEGCEERRLNQGVPRRSTCVFCHSRAGGDDNVKHGDISTRMGFAKATDPAADPAKYLSRKEDVHMGYDPVTKRGGDMNCVACHQVKKDASGSMIDHGIGGFMYHSVDEGVMKDCTDCHGSTASIHVGTSVERVLQSQAHDRLACQVCHIPAFAREVATYVDWKWSLAGQDTRPAACAASPTGVAATCHSARNLRQDEGLLHLGNRCAAHPALLRRQVEPRHRRLEQHVYDHAGSTWARVSDLQGTRPPGSTRSRR